MKNTSLKEQAVRQVHHSDEAALITDRQGVIDYVNPAFEALTGFTAAQALGRTPAILKSGEQGQEFYRALWGTLGAGGEYHGTLVNRRRDGSLYHEEKHIRPLLGSDGSIAHYLARGHEVGDPRASATTHAPAADVDDQLTGLPGRALFDDRLATALAHAQESGESLAVAVIDLERVGELNDRLGRASGDAVLRAAAQKLRAVVRKGDMLARVGGHKFALLLPSAEGASRALAALTDALRSPVALKDGMRAAIDASVGVAFFPGDGATSGALLQAADRAMQFDKTLSNASRDERPEAALADAKEPGDPLFARLARHVPFRRSIVRADQVIYHAGDRFQDLFVLHVGLCKLTSVSAEGREELVSLLYTGDWLGFDGLAEGRHSCTARATDTGEVWRVSYETLLRAGSREPELLAALHLAMARQSARERNGMLSQHGLPANGRVADFLCRWAEGLETRGLRTDQITLPVSRAEIASHLGLRIESVSRAMSRLEREKLIRFGSPSRRELSIPRLAALREFVRRTGQ